MFVHNQSLYAFEIDVAITSQNSWINLNAVLILTFDWDNISLTNPFDDFIPNVRIVLSVFTYNVSISRFCLVCRPSTSLMVLFQGAV